VEVPPGQCPAIGYARSATNQALNVLKNRDSTPAGNQINQNVTLEAMLADGDDHGRFDQGQAAEITGHVIDVQQGGAPETANCNNLTKPYTDTHIMVALDATAAKTAALVVEVTPKWRAAMAKQNVDWGTDTLFNTIKGHKVTFRGWLLFDTDHVTQAINTAPNNPKDWRKTVWEIHPITSMQVVQ
jgi:hypothetical protein